MTLKDRGETDSLGWSLSWLKKSTNSIFPYFGWFSLGNEAREDRWATGWKEELLYNNKYCRRQKITFSLNMIEVSRYITPAMTFSWGRGTQSRLMIWETSWSQILLLDTFPGAVQGPYGALHTAHKAQSFANALPQCNKDRVTSCILQMREWRHRDTVLPPTLFQR